MCPGRFEFTSVLREVLSPGGGLPRLFLMSADVVGVVIRGQFLEESKVVWGADWGKDGGARGHSRCSGLRALLPGSPPKLGGACGVSPDAEGEGEAVTQGAWWVVLGVVPADRADGKQASKLAREPTGCFPVALSCLPKTHREGITG